MVLQLRQPDTPTLGAIGKLWPTWISYGVSYLFIAIVWVNHHYVFKHAKESTWRLIWANFGHLFVVSWIPFLTGWIADTRMAPVPVALYAFIFLMVNVTYLIFVYETLGYEVDTSVPVKVRRLLHLRSMGTLLLFSSATIISFWFPLAGFSLICVCLVLYLRPDVPKRLTRRS